MVYYARETKAMATVNIGYSIKGGCISRTVTLPNGRGRRTALKAQSLVDGTMTSYAVYDLAWLTSKTMPRSRNSQGEFRIIDLFCGYGGGLYDYAALVLGHGFCSAVIY